MRQPGRAAPYVITFLLGTTLAGGGSAVAASAAGSATACETSKHLVVGAADGKCPKGTAAHVIGASGARGLRGKPGTNGLSQAVIGAPLYPSTFSGTATNVDEITNLPAGNYVASFEVLVTAGVGGLEAECQLMAGATATLDNTTFLATRVNSLMQAS